mmetsp:Transcript_110601/g.191717  ORF Transcript_110601/g.191717 Transcript_110601/m.191717 type:complete len:310 (-) Transcript_110601:413-1342(-)
MEMARYPETASVKGQFDTLQDGIWRQVEFIEEHPAAVVETEGEGAEGKREHAPIPVPAVAQDHLPKEVAGGEGGGHHEPLQGGPRPRGAVVQERALAHARGALDQQRPPIAVRLQDGVHVLEGGQGEAEVTGLRHEPCEDAVGRWGALQAHDAVALEVHLQVPQFEHWVGDRLQALQGEGGWLPPGMLAWHAVHGDEVQQGPAQRAQVFVVQTCGQSRDVGLQGPPWPKGPCPVASVPQNPQECFQVRSQRHGRCGPGTALHEGCHVLCRQVGGMQPQAPQQVRPPVPFQRGGTQQRRPLGVVEPRGPA